MTNLRINESHGQQGFTLIELIVVIVVLGLLAATAVPKYLSMAKDARIAAVNGVAGGLNSAVNMVTSKAILSTPTGGVLTDGGISIKVVIGGKTTSAYFPDATADGIGNAFNGPGGNFTSTYTAAAANTPAKVTYRPANGGSEACQVTYTAPSSTTDGAVAAATDGC